MLLKHIFPLPVLLLLSIVQKNLASVDLQFLKNLAIDEETQQNLVRHVVSFIGNIHYDGEDSKEFNLRGDFSNLTNVKGFAKMCDGNITGLNSIIRDLKTEINGTTFDLIANLRINGGISVKSTNEVDMSIQNTTQFQSYGAFLFEIMDVSITIRLKMSPVYPKLNVTEFAIEKISIDGIGITGEDTMLNGIEDWEFIFDGIAAYWHDSNIEQIVEKKATKLLNGLLKNCTLQELIAFSQGEPLTCAGDVGIKLPIEFPPEQTCAGRPTHPPVVTTTTDSSNHKLSFNYNVSYESLGFKNITFKNIFSLSATK